MENILHVGLDVGSTTVKIVVIDSNKKEIYSDYTRHFQIQKILFVMFRNLAKSFQIANLQLLLLVQELCLQLHS